MLVLLRHIVVVSFLGKSAAELSSFATKPGKQTHQSETINPSDNYHRPISRKSARQPGRLCGTSGADEGANTPILSGRETRGLPSHWFLRCLRVRNILPCTCGMLKAYRGMTIVGANCETVSRCGVRHMVQITRGAYCTIWSSRLIYGHYLCSEELGQAGGGGHKRAVGADSNPDENYIVHFQ